MAFNKSLAGYFDDLQHIGMPTDDLKATVAFWNKGIKFFNIEGPNAGTIEFCEIILFL